MGVSQKFCGVTRDNLNEFGERHHVQRIAAIIASVNDEVNSWAQFAGESGSAVSTPHHRQRPQLDSSSARQECKLSHCVRQRTELRTNNVSTNQINRPQSRAIHCCLIPSIAMMPAERSRVLVLRARSAAMTAAGACRPSNRTFAGRL